MLQTVFVRGNNIALVNEFVSLSFHKKPDGYVRRQHVGGQEMGLKRLFVRMEIRRKIVIVFSRIGDQQRYRPTISYDGGHRPLPVRRG